MTDSSRKVAPIRIGIVGCGAIAANHMRALRHIKAVKVVALCDRNSDVANALAAKHGIPSVHEDALTMLLEERLQSLHVTTPPRTHAPICELALQSGCHVLVEKPIALALSDLDAMLDMARANGLALSAVHNGLYQRAFHRALVAVQAGAIGQLRSVHITDHIPSNCDIAANAAHWCHGLSGGIYGEMLPHDIYLADALVPGLRLNDVRAYGSGRHSWLPVEQVFTSLSSGSSMVTLHVGVDGACWNKTIEITGTTGTIRVDRMCDIVTNITATSDWTLRTHCHRVASHVAAWMQQSAETAAARLSRHPQTGHDTLIWNFYSAMERGEAPPVSVEALRRTTKLYEELTAAIDSNISVS